MLVGTLVLGLLFSDNQIDHVVVILHFVAMNGLDFSTLMSKRPLISEYCLGYDFLLDFIARFQCLFEQSKHFISLGDI